MTNATTHVDFLPTATQAPDRPSKWDIIPIHNSDRATFKFCRRQWAWSSPNRLNLVPRASIYGINKNFWFGTGIHHALERYYNPVIREDPWIAWETWFNLQWLGGIVSEDEVKQYVDRDPQIIHDGNNEFSYKVSGLCDILPDFGDDNEEIFLGLKDLGIGMMKFYKQYAEANDDFTVIMVEHDFSVPVLNEKGEALYAVDTRVMPEGWEPDFDTTNEFGPLMRYADSTIQALESNGVRMSAYDDTILKQVHVRGRMDQIQQEHEHGRMGIMDYKTASKIDDDYFRHLELDEQCTSYLAFGQLEAQLHDLPYKQLEYITYQALLKGYPKPPTILKSGLPSTDRSKATSAALFEDYIISNGLKPIFDVDEKLQRYYAYLLEMGDKLYIQREPTWRNAAQRINAMTRLYYEARDMLSNPVLYPNPSKNYSCIRCAFRTPCIQAETGDDFMDTLDNGYIPNWDR